MQSVEDMLNENATLLAGAALIEKKRQILSVATISAAAAILPVYGITRLMSDSEGSRFDTLAERLVGAGGPLFSLISFIQKWEPDPFRSIPK